MILKIASIWVVLLLGGCGQSASSVVQQIQDKTVLVCSFLPSQQSVLEIVKATTNVDVAVIANAICSAVTAWAAKGEEVPKTPELMDYQTTVPAPKLLLVVDEPEKDCPRVNGVCIAGTFVDKKGNPVDKPPDETVRPKEEINQ